MKKKVLSIVLALAMIVSLMVPAHVEAETFKLISTGGELTDGEWWLYEDLVLTSPIVIPVGVNVTIDLKGNTLTGALKYLIVNKGTLTIKDSGSTVHYYEFVEDDAWKPSKESKEAVSVDELGLTTETGTIVKVTGGVISNTPDEKAGAVAAIYNLNGKLTIDGGNFIGTKNVDSGAILSENGSELIINKVNMLGNVSVQGGAIFNRNSTAVIGKEDGKDSDVVIAFNVASTYSGGGILNNVVSQDEAAEATLILNSGIIRNNKSLDENGGGISNIVSRGSKGTAMTTIYGGQIYANIAAKIGGGIYNRVSRGATGKAILTIEGGEIAGNLALKGIPNEIFGNGETIDNRKETEETITLINKLFDVIERDVPVLTILVKICKYLVKYLGISFGTTEDIGELIPGGL